MYAESEMMKFITLDFDTASLKKTTTRATTTFMQGATQVDVAGSAFMQGATQVDVAGSVVCFAQLVIHSHIHNKITL